MDSNVAVKRSYEEYIEKLEDEKRKIQVFARELPLCLELVSHAIETCKQQLAVQSQGSEQTTVDEGPVLEEFIPIKKNSSDDENFDNGDVDEQMFNESEDEKLSKKSDWLRSVQLWNRTPDQDAPEKGPTMDIKRSEGGAFHPFKREKLTDSTKAAKSPSTIPVAAVASSTGESGGGGGSSKKDRRCWSPELHKRFLQALQELGGSHVATPKQIRELMKVDGLTNDEVKSHLQKYRLHTKRPTPLVQNDNNVLPPQFVMVSGIWIPPPDYDAATTTTLSGEASEVYVPNTVYAPIASHPPIQNHQNKKLKKFHSDVKESLSIGGGRCSSPATSSSTHTSPTSPAC